jgi:hypothetical protein
MIKFCILGDMGSGEISQHNVAKAMYHNIVANKIKFVCGLGDNIYPAGCYKPDDPQFKDKFETPYKKIPDNIKFYMCLGNHDYGNYWDQTFRNCSNNQIEYGIKSQIIGKKWYLPGNYYTFSKKQGDVTIDFFIIDTNLELMSDKLKKEQMKFTVDALKESKADWKILYGHHTFISIAGHGNADPELDKYLRKLFRLGVDMYMNGHDHTKQIIEFNIGGKTIPIITCGTGGKPYDDGPLNYSNIKRGSKLVWNAETLGFGTVFCDKKSIRLEMYDENNVLEKEYTFNKKSNTNYNMGTKKKVKKKKTYNKHNREKIIKKKTIKKKYKRKNTKKTINKQYKRQNTKKKTIKKQYKGGGDPEHLNLDELLASNDPDILPSVRPKIELRNPFKMKKPVPRPSAQDLNDETEAEAKLEAAEAKLKASEANLEAANKAVEAANKNKNEADEAHANSIENKKKLFKYAQKIIFTVGGIKKQTKKLKDNKVNAEESLQKAEAKAAAEAEVKAAAEAEVEAAEAAKAEAAGDSAPQ